MLELYLIRHAESEANKTPEIICGRDNSTPLSENGRYQAVLLGKRLQEQKLIFDTVYSSVALRAYQTAAIASQHINYPLEHIITAKELVELNQGDWEGKLRDEIYTPELIKDINSNNWDFKAPNGESQKDIEERMYDWIETTLLPQAPTSPRIAVYSHGFAIKCLFRKIMNSDASQTYLISIDNTSITRFNYGEDNKWRLVNLNDSAHISKK